MNANTQENQETKKTYTLQEIRENVELIKKEVNRMELEGKSDPFDFELQLMESMPEFYGAHPFLVKKLCKREDISILYKMLENLEQVEQGNKSMASVELNLGDQLAKQYLYPSLNKNKKK